MNPPKNSNFYQDKVYQLLSKVARTEPTVELELYWLKRYQEITQNLSFSLSEHTVEMAFEDIVTRPSTPSGLINIEQIIDDKNQIQEASLQNIIETAIRLLDAILDIINFDDAAKKTVKEFRKIAIGIENLDSYLTIPELLVDQVDYLGELISNSVYRASESLAEEKGACLRWEDIKSEVSSKSFEYWFNPDSGEIRTSLEIQEYINNNPESRPKIMGEFEIVARRGSHLLLYANTPEWLKWSDRKPTQSPPAGESNIGNEEIEDELALEIIDEPIESESEDEIQSEIQSELEATVEDEIESEEEIKTILKDEQIELPEFLQKSAPLVTPTALIDQEKLSSSLTQEIDSLNQHIINVNSSKPITHANDVPVSKLGKEHSKNFAFPDMIDMEDILPGLIGDTKKWDKDEDDFNSIFGLDRLTTNPAKPNNTKSQIQQIEEGRVQPIKVEMAKDEEEKLEDQVPLPAEEITEADIAEEDLEIAKTLPQIATIFGIGELVKVISTSGVSDFYQIVEILIDNNVLYYHLTDRDDAQVVKICSEGEIQPALLEELILSANIGTRIKNNETDENNIPEVTQDKVEIKPLSEYFAQAIVFNQNGQVLLYGDNLPQILVPQDASNVETLNNYLANSHNIAIKDVEEIGTFASDDCIKTIFLGQLDDESNQTKAIGLSVVDIDQALILVPNLEKYLSKASEKEMQAKKRFAQLNNQLKIAVGENQNLKQKIRLLGLNLQVIADENGGTRVGDSNNIQKAINTRGDYKYLHTTEHSRFSKFFPVIEQVIEDDEIGKITLNIQYDSFGAKKASIVVDSEKLRDKDYTLLTSYLNLVNTSLASGASLADVSYVLEHQGKGKLDFGNNLINKILLILSLCFLAMPRSIEQINSSDIIIVTLAKVLDSLNRNQSLLEIVLEDDIRPESKTEVISHSNQSAAEKSSPKSSRFQKKARI